MTDDVDLDEFGVFDNALLQRRWREMARELAPTLPGTWRLRGRGRSRVLVREPIEWTVAWIGFSRSAFSESGWFMAAVEPLVKPTFSWALSFGLRMDEVRNGPKDVDLRDDSAARDLARFAHEAALAELDRWTVERLAGAAEKSLKRPLERRRPPHYWLMAPGWRVLLDTGSPREVFDEVVDFFGSRDLQEQLPFYQDLCDRWESGGRPEALAFLQSHRDHKLEAARLTTRPQG
ncbi:hypothetical protein ACFQU9_07805 [Actinomadura namibiensis]|uniref:DUF4304 domain-containing protein n=1 Tax=Actinomadura namibiensis TaxID=182080 RepID=A0A7W3QSA3_ACTNM|nr:hypothetical protein [Actinomadura namibiensis]MBA8957644.1 hypothetical protein [Actinomadura namibiensis]